MAEFLTAAQMQDLETRAIESGAVTGACLMERAGQAVLDAIRAHWPDLPSVVRAVVLCGPGNNGGDGYVVARLLRDHGCDVRVFAYGSASRLPPDARLNADRWRSLAPGQTTEMGFPDLAADDVRRLSAEVLGPPPADLLIDALFGLGLTRPLQALAPVFALNRDAMAADHPVRIVSIDLPSGLNDLGVAGATTAHVIRADLTVTFHSRKQAHNAGAEYCGRIVVADIGLSPERPASDRSLG